MYVEVNSIWNGDHVPLYKDMMTYADLIIYTMESNCYMAWMWYNCAMCRKWGLFLYEHVPFSCVRMGLQVCVSDEESISNLKNNGRSDKPKGIFTDARMSYDSYFFEGLSVLICII